jgi:ankyrin repeat protein
MCFFRVLAGKNAKLDVSLPNLATALHLAVRSGSELLVQALLAKGLDPNATGPKAYTPLHLAALHSHPALVEMLLKAEAQVNSEIKINTISIFHFSSYVVSS